ncbi:hypothetical protein MUNTM_38700 [Mycobacterium sp. MUNTM1]
MGIDAAADGPRHVAALLTSMGPKGRRSGWDSSLLSHLMAHRSRIRHSCETTATVGSAIAPPTLANQAASPTGRSVRPYGAQVTR